MDVVGVPRLAPAGDLFCLIFRRKRDLPQPRAVGVHFPNTKAGSGVLAKIKHNLLRVKRQADLADESLPARHVRRGHHAPLRSRPQVEDVDTVVGMESVRAGAVVDVGVVVVRRIGFAFDEHDLVKAKCVGIGGGLRCTRVERGGGGDFLRLSGVRRSQAVSCEGGVRCRTEQG